MNNKTPRYLPLDLNFIKDNRIKRLCKDIPNCSGFGMVVGLFFYLAKEKNLKCRLDDLDLIADELRTSVPLLKTIIKSYGLFSIVEENGEKFFSIYLNELLLPYFDKCEQNSINARIGVEKRRLKKQKQLDELYKLRLSYHNSSQQTLNDCSANRIKKKKEEKIKKDIKILKSLTSLSSMEISKLDIDTLKLSESINLLVKKEGLTNVLELAENYEQYLIDEIIKMENNNDK